MPQPYESFRFLYPPRPLSKIPFDLTSPVMKAWMNAPDSVTQLKLNGSRNVIFVAPDGNITMYNRHAEPHRSFTPNAAMIEQVRSLPLPKGQWSVLDSELLHLKTPAIKNTLYFYDVLVWGGVYLVGKTYAERYKIVESFGLPSFPLDLPPRMDGKMFMAQNLPKADLQQIWLKIKGNTPMQPGDAFEGFVMKRTGPLSALATGYRVENNGGWLVRVRRSHKNYQF